MKDKGKTQEQLRAEREAWLRAEEAQRLVTQKGKTMQEALLTIKKK